MTKVTFEIEKNKEVKHTTFIINNDNTEKDLHNEINYWKFNLQTFGGWKINSYSLKKYNKDGK